MAGGDKVISQLTKLPSLRRLAMRYLDRALFADFYGEICRDISLVGGGGGDDASLGCPNGENASAVLGSCILLSSYRGGT